MTQAKYLLDLRIAKDNQKQDHLCVNISIATIGLKIAIQKLFFFHLIIV